MLFLLSMFQPYRFVNTQLVFGYCLPIVELTLKIDNYSGLFVHKKTPRDQSQCVPGRVYTVSECYDKQIALNCEMLTKVLNQDVSSM